MKILYLSRLFPYPPSDGTKLRVYNLLRGLVDLHDVTFLAFNDQPEIEPDVRGLESLCSRVEVIPLRTQNPKGLRSLLGLVVPVPRFLWDTYSRDMADRITSLLQDHDFDLVIASNMTMAFYRPYYRNMPAVFEEFEMGSWYDEMYSKEFKKRFRRSLSWVKLRFYLAHTLRSFQAVTVVSALEMKTLERMVPGQAEKISILPNCVNVDEYINLESRPIPKTLIYSGSFKYTANYEAMVWFVKAVYPRVLDKAPDTHLYITGDHRGFSLPFHHNITLTGYVENIKEYIGSAWISIVPMKSGEGTRLKVLEAMAIGVPVVSTSKGVEGLEAVPEVHFLLGNTAQEFANQVLRILKDPDLHDELAGNARKLVEQKYNWKLVYPRFLDLVERVAHG